MPSWAEAENLWPWNTVPETQKPSSVLAAAIQCSKATAIFHSDPVHGFQKIVWLRPASSAELDYHQHMEQLLYAVMLLQLEGLYCRSCSDQSVPLGRKGALFEMLCVINQHSKVLPAAGGGGGERNDCRLSLNCLGSPLCVFHQGLLLAFLQIY